jgi:protein transport protein SEC61 subunit alpha
VAFDEKLVWTVCSALLYFVMSELPLYGIRSTVESGDPIHWLRPIFASTRGSLMEIGALPIVSAGFLFQLLGGMQIIDVNFEMRSDRELYQSAQKFLAILLTIAQAIAIVLSGVYGSPSDLGASGTLLLITQLVMAGMAVILIDETLQKGYGFGSAVSLFTTLSISQQFVWNTLSMSANDQGRGKEFTGSLISLFHMLWTRNTKTALIESFYRTHLPNMFEFYGSVLAFGAVVYLLNFRYDISIKSTKVRSPASVYPIRLLYTGNIPVYMLYSIVANLFIFSAALYRLFPFNILVRLFGTWETRAGNPQLFAVSGLAYYLQPPFSLAEALWDPIKTVVYATTLVTSCIVFSKTWTEISGSSPRDVAKQFKDNGIVIVGHRDVAVIKELKRIIPSAAAIGGALGGLVVVSLDLLGVAGCGVSCLVVATTIYSYFEILAQETGGQQFNLGQM